MKLIKTSFFSAIITVIRIGSGFVAGKFVAIFTGPSGVAVIGQFVNFITIILTFANGAINAGVVKYTAEYEDDDRKLKLLFSTSLKISVYSSAIIGILLLFTASYFSLWIFESPIYINPLRVLGVTAILYSLNSLFISILNGKKQINIYTIVNTAGSIIGLIFTIALVYFYKLEGALYSLVLSQAIVFFVTLILIIKSDWFSWSYFNQKFDKELALKLSKFGLMAVVSSITGPVSQILLRKILVAKLDIDSAGYWQGMMRISDGYLLLIITSLSTYYLPKLSSLHTDKELRQEILNGYKIVLPLVFVGCVVIYFMRFLIIKTLYTSDFQHMESLFLFQLIGDFFKIAAWMLGYLIVAKAMTKIYIISEILFGISYVLLGYIFVHFFKLNGISIAFAANYFIYLLVVLFIFRKLIFGHVKS